MDAKLFEELAASTFFRPNSRCRANHILAESQSDISHSAGMGASTPGIQLKEWYSYEQMYLYHSSIIL
jgi:hypothetical protein